MKRFIFLCLGLIFSSGITTARAHVENPLFAYTHLLPSPFTLPAGRFVIGSRTAVGVTHFLELETDLLLNFYKIYNGRIRFSLLDFPGFAFGAYLGYQNVNLSDLSSSNPNLVSSSWMPGGVFGMEIMPNIALFLGGNLFFSNLDFSSFAISSSGFLRGAQIESDISWAYHPDKEKLGNVISAGFTYNTTFSFYGVGVSHHWPGFHLGVHYYPNSTNLKVYPILSGGAVVDL